MRGPRRLRDSSGRGARSARSVLTALTIFDILMSVDMKELAMLGRFRRTRELTVSFCERCGSVCDSACRAEAVREHALRRALAYGWRQA